MTTPAPSSHSKPCSRCGTPRDVLVRCQIDDSRAWVFVCPGRCWREVSGGQIDGDNMHPHYRYGGMWKNKHEAVSAKKRKKGREGLEPPQWQDGNSNAAGEGQLDKKYTRNDKVSWNGKVWTCRKSHLARDSKTPDQEVGLWAEEGPVEAH